VKHDHKQAAICPTLFTYRGKCIKYPIFQRDREKLYAPLESQLEPNGTQLYNNYYLRMFLNKLYEIHSDVTQIMKGLFYDQKHT